MSRSAEALEREEVLREEAMQEAMEGAEKAGQAAEKEIKIVKKKRIEWREE